ncbi:MAG TPA: hypothetical protein DCG53_00615, partial [Syntrophus sp. (in: bacteria)]|nr:hypothetical protein [Syntrophus sp. (in: bacteria)]
MKFKIILILSVIVLLFGCATYPRTSEEQAKHHANKARAAFSKGDSTEKSDHIDTALTETSGDIRIKELFVSHPQGRDYYRMHLEETIARVSNVYQANAAFDRLSAAKSAGLFPEDQMNDLLAKLEKTVTNGNVSGSIPFDFSEPIDRFPYLNDPVNQRIMLDRSIKNLQTKGNGNRPVKALIEYVQKVGPDSAEGKRIESLLPTLNIRSDELDIIANVFPQFVKARKEEISVSVFLQVKNGDRLLTEDILQALRGKVRGV